MLKRRARSARRPARRRRAGRSRILVALALVLLVPGLAYLVFLDVTLTQRFDGRLWQLPSSVYSDVLTLFPGDTFSAAELASRLDRSGYGRSPGPPQLPGQYRLTNRGMEVHLRQFEAPGLAAPAAWLRLGFRGDRLVSIADRDGRHRDSLAVEPELLATLFGPRQEERRVTRLEQVPQAFIDAVLAAEDARFHSHHGLDPLGILRAAGANLRQRRIAQGGSTITQQTVKNLFLSQERSWWRKLREGMMAVLLEVHYPKERILEVYLNEVYLGQRGPVAICGVQAAARHYFGRDLQDLSLRESAVLAGLIRSPGRYNPLGQPARAAERGDQVLAAMERLSLLTAEQVEAAREEPLALAGSGGGYTGAAHAVDYVRAQLIERYPSRVLTEDGLRIYTSLDTAWQGRAERALTAGLEGLETRFENLRKQEGRRLQGAVIVMDPVSGAILGMVGGRDYAESQFNRAVQARRQPGSCFKPFVYAAGFDLAVRGAENGLTPATLLEDSPLSMRSGGQTWTPVNYDHQYRGPVTVRRALEESLNIPTVRAANHVGIDTVIDRARRCGIESPLADLPSLALGAAEVTPLELATAYATLARGGMHLPAWIIREVTDRNGKPLARVRVEPTRAISPQAAHLVNDILRGVLERGTARSASQWGYFGAAAGKTGTTDDTRDAWFVGYTSNLLVLSWVGYDDNTRTGLTGATGALPIWADVMHHAADPPWVEPPEGVVERRIDPETGDLATAACPSTIDEQFPEEMEPTRSCLLHQGRIRRWFDRLRSRGV